MHINISYYVQHLREDAKRLLAEEERKRAKSQRQQEDPTQSNKGGTSTSTQGSYVHTYVYLCVTTVLYEKC